jgi:hypothetical protein
MISTVITAHAPAVTQTMIATLGLIVLLTISEVADAAEVESLKILRRNLLVFIVPLLVVLSFTVIMVLLGFMS